VLSWPDLLASALVGTDRRPPTGVAGGDPATGLLDAAAALALARRAGQRPVTGVPAPVPPPADPAPTASAAAARRLNRLLETTIFDADTRSELLVEWLRTAADRGVRVPGEQLPTLIELALRRRELRPLVVAAGGTRVGWLAAQYPGGRFLTGEPDPDLADRNRWELGTISQRVEHLTAARRADPAAARELLVAGWAGESPDDRAALLGTLATGLSLGDEEFLEAALDDRRREVRGVALDLLGRLPGSAYQGRMISRARAYLQAEGGALTVAPPRQCDPDMQRDGVSPRPPAGVGERTWWLEEVLARTPLSTWGTDDPARFLGLSMADGWREVVLRGLARAASVGRDPAWAGALIDALLATPGARERPDDMLLVESLYSALPPDELVNRAIDALRGDGPRRAGRRRDAPGVDHLLELCPRPWPEPLVEAVFAALEGYADRAVPSWRIAELCQLAAVRLPASAAGRAAAFADSVVAPAGLAYADRRSGRLGGSAAFDDGPIHQDVVAFAEILRFRYRMLEELR
jgi:hypothetical protein